MELARFWRQVMSCIGECFGWSDRVHFPMRSWVTIRFNSLEVIDLLSPIGVEVDKITRDDRKAIRADDLLKPQVQVDKNEEALSFIGTLESSPVLLRRTYSDSTLLIRSTYPSLKEMQRDDGSKLGGKPTAQRTPKEAGAKASAPESVAADASEELFLGLVKQLKDKGRFLKTGEYIDAVESRDVKGVFERSSPVISEPPTSRRPSEASTSGKAPEDGQAALEALEAGAKRRLTFLEESPSSSFGADILYQEDNDEVAESTLVKAGSDCEEGDFGRKVPDREEFEAALFAGFAARFAGASYEEALDELNKVYANAGVELPEDAALWGMKRSVCPFWAAEVECPFAAACPLNHCSSGSENWDVFKEQSARGQLARTIASLSQLPVKNQEEKEEQEESLPFRGRDYVGKKVLTKLLTAIRRLEVAESLRLEDVPVMNFLGPSGIGKSRLLEALGTLVKRLAEQELAEMRPAKGETDLKGERKRKNLQKLLEVIEGGGLVETTIRYAKPGNQISNTIDSHGDPAVSMGLRLCVGRFLPEHTAASLVSFLTSQQPLQALAPAHLLAFTPANVLSLSSYFMRKRVPKLSKSGLPIIEFVKQDDMERVASIYSGSSAGYAKQMQETLDGEWSSSGMEENYILSSFLAGALVVQYDDVSSSRSRPYVIALDGLDFPSSLEAMGEVAAKKGLEKEIVEAMLHNAVFRTLVARGCGLPVILSYVKESLADARLLTELAVSRGYSTVATVIEDDIFQRIEDDVLGQDDEWVRFGKHFVHLAVTGMSINWTDKIVPEKGGPELLVKEAFRGARFACELVGDNKARVTVKLAEVLLVSMARRLGLRDTPFLQGCLEASDITEERLEQLVRQTLSLRANTILTHHQVASRKVLLSDLFPGAIGSTLTLETEVLLTKIYVEHAGEPFFTAAAPQPYRPTVRLLSGHERAWEEANFLLALDIQKKGGMSGHKAALLDDLWVLNLADKGDTNGRMLAAVQVKGEEGTVSGERLAVWNDKVDAALKYMAPHFRVILKVWVAKASVSHEAVRYASRQDNFLLIGRKTLGVFIPSVSDSLAASKRPI